MENNEEMFNQPESDELAHWGIKGQKWGIRRYQNPDGTLTEAGKKRYNKEMEKVKKEQEVLKNKRETKAKLDELDKMKRDVKAQKQALKDEKAKKKKHDPDDDLTNDERKAKLMKSTDAKKLFENRDMLTNAEIQDRLTRIRIEKELAKEIQQVTRKTFADHTEAALKIFKTTDNVYKTLSESALGKALFGKGGEKTPTLKELFDNPDKYTVEQMQAGSKKAASKKVIGEAMESTWGKKNKNNSSNKTEEKKKEDSSSGEKKKTADTKQAEKVVKQAGNKGTKDIPKGNKEVEEWADDYIKRYGDQTKWLF